MAAIRKTELERALRSGLRLKAPRFHLEKAPGGKWSGSVVSDSFRRKKDLHRQKMIWAALEEAFGQRCTEYIGTLLAYTNAEWDIDLEGVPERRRRKKAV